MFQFVGIARGSIAEQLMLLFHGLPGLLQGMVNALSGSADAFSGSLLQYSLYIQGFGQIAKDLAFQALVIFMGLYLCQIIDNTIEALIHQIHDVLIEAVLLLYIENQYSFFLPVPIQSADTLHQSHGVPRQVVVNHDMATALQIYPLAARLGGDQELSLPFEVLDGSFALGMSHGAIDKTHLVLPKGSAQQAVQMLLGGGVLSEKQQFFSRLMVEDGRDDLVEQITNLEVIVHERPGLINQLLQQ